MTLKEDLLSKGFQAHGPISYTKIYGVINQYYNEKKDLSEIRIVPSRLAGKDTEEHSNLWMVYIKKTSQTQQQNNQRELFGITA